MRTIRSPLFMRTLSTVLAALFTAGAPGIASLPRLGGVALAASDARVAVVGVFGNPDSYEEDLNDMTEELVDLIDRSPGFEARGPDSFGRSVWDRKSSVLEDVFLGAAQASLQEGKVLYDNAQFQGALSSLEKAESSMERGIEFLRDPRLLVEIHLYLGLTHTALGNHEDAQEHFEEVARTDPARTLDPVRTPPNMIEAFEDAKLFISESGSVGVEVMSGDVEGASIYINGRRAGTTPTYLDLAPGEYHIAVEHPEEGWDYQKERFYAGDDLTLDFVLIPQGIRPMGREKTESSRSRRVQSLFRSLGETIDADLLLLAALDDGDNLQLQLYSPRSDVFSGVSEGLVMSGGRIDRDVLSELVTEVLYMTDGSGGIRPDNTTTTTSPLYIGRNPTLNRLLTGAEPSLATERVTVRDSSGGRDDGRDGGGRDIERDDGGRDGGRDSLSGTGGDKKPVHKRAGFWILIGAAVAGGAAAAIGGIAYSQTEPVMGPGTVTVVIEP